MNESEKNIETCLPESILAEVASVPTDPQFRSLVEESFDPLQQQAVQQAGSDAYNEVVASHKPYTFTSSVEEMKSNLILLLRRFWRFPFGAGTIRSLSDMWQHYITRLQGSETYGIPSRLDQLTDLPSAPLLVADRKISGVPEAADGMPYIRLLNDVSLAATITEMYDDTKGWVRNSPLNLASFTGLKKLSLGMRSVSLSGSNALIRGNSSIEEIEFTDIETAYTQQSYAILHECSALKVVKADTLKSYDSSDHQCGFIEVCNALTHFYARGFEELKGDYRNALISWCPELTNVYLTAPTLKDASGNNHGSFGECPKLIRLEVGCYRLVDKSLNIKFWNPATALDSSLTDLIEEGSTAANNLQQFLSNFRSFIVLRLANRKSTTALTLTLSANVYNAVTGANSGWASQHTLAELGITDNDLTDLETELGITSATIYATWLDTYTGANGIHWDINKAN